MKIEKLTRIDWRKTEKTDDLNYLRQVAVTVGVKWVGTSKDDLRKKVLAERKIGRKPLDHKQIGARDEKAIAKLPSKTAQIKALFAKEYHPSVISKRVDMHITNVYACLRNAGIIQTGKTIKKATIAKIKATKKEQSAEAEKKADKKETVKK